MPFNETEDQLTKYLIQMVNDRLYTLRHSIQRLESFALHQPLTKAESDSLIDYQHEFQLLTEWKNNLQSNG